MLVLTGIIIKHEREHCSGGLTWKSGEKLEVVGADRICSAVRAACVTVLVAMSKVFGVDMLTHDRCRGSVLSLFGDRS